MCLSHEIDLVLEKSQLAWPVLHINIKCWRNKNLKIIIYSNWLYDF